MADAPRRRQWLPRDQPASSGLRLWTVARHSQPSDSVASWDRVSETAPVLVIGHTKCPRSSLLASRHKLIPCKRALVAALRA